MTSSIFSSCTAVPIYMKTPHQIDSKCEKEVLSGNTAGNVCLTDMQQKAHNETH